MRHFGPDISSFCFKYAYGSNFDSQLKLVVLNNIKRVILKVDQRSKVQSQTTFTD